MSKDTIDPTHYHCKDASGIHCYVAQTAMLGLAGYQDYMVGCALKYVWRWRGKNGKEDLRKAIKCLNMVLDTFKDQNFPMNPTEETWIVSGLESVRIPMEEPTSS